MRESLIVSRVSRAPELAACYIRVVKRKRPEPGSAALSESIVPKVLLEEARKAIESDRFKKVERCTVCGSESAPTSNEGLCWVCRRLKLSAWKDSDTQMPAQE